MQKLASAIRYPGIKDVTSLHLLLYYMMSTNHETDLYEIFPHVGDSYFSPSRQNLFVYYNLGLYNYIFQSMNLRPLCSVSPEHAGQINVFASFLNQTTLQLQRKGPVAANALFHT